MDYRNFLKGNGKISTIGIGGSKLHLASDEEVSKIIDLALERGVNSIDFATETGDVFPKVGKAIKGRREKFQLGLHLGLTYQEDGQYKCTRDIKAVEEGFNKHLAELGTDYADFGYIHYVDDVDDFNSIFDSGVYDYALKLKKEGIIRKLGFASHKVDISRMFLEKGDFDLFMFSINPAYDLDPVTNNPLEEDWSSMNSLSVAKERVELYQLAEKMGVGIVVMKPLGAGRLLDARTSPFKRAMSVAQCIQYCLDRPGVISCMVGVDSLANLEGLLSYYDTTKEERDYSFIASTHFEEMLGKCVYCNHCLPCPSNIDIARVNKFLDLAEVGDALAKEHYLSLENKASSCIMCGACEENCPFKVQVRDRMRAANSLFGV